MILQQALHVGHCSSNYAGDDAICVALRVNRRHIIMRSDPSHGSTQRNLNAVAIDAHWIGYCLRHLQLFVHHSLSSKHLLVACPAVTKSTCSLGPKHHES